MHKRNRNIITSLANDASKTLNISICDDVGYFVRCHILSVLKSVLFENTKDSAQREKGN